MEEVKSVNTRSKWERRNSVTKATKMAEEALRERLDDVNLSKNPTTGELIPADLVNSRDTGKLAPGFELSD